MLDIINTMPSTSATSLAPDDRDRALQQLPAWRLDGDAIEREYVFADFAQAFGFMTQMALLAERLDHHPDWSNSYNRVQVRLSTHDLGGLSSLDIELARAMDGVAAQFSTILATAAQGDT